MPRALDHIVIPSHDLAAESALYARLGFQVGPLNRHPWGTENHIIQFEDAFLELIGLGADFVPPDLAPKEFSFGGFVERYLRAQEGLAMLVLRSDNAEADRARFARAGLGDFSRFDFARQGRRPNGEAVNVAFSLAFAASPAWPDTGFFVCQQHYPENFWNAAAQVHPNGALGVAAVRFEHPDPRQGLEFVSAFLEATPTRKDRGYVFAADNGRVELSEGPRPALKALAFRVRDLEECRRALQAGAVPHEERGGALRIAPETAMGAELLFESA